MDLKQLHFLFLLFFIKTNTASVNANSQHYQLGHFVKQTDLAKLDTIFATLDTLRKLECATYCQKKSQCQAFSIYEDKRVGSTTLWKCNFSEQISWNNFSSGYSVFLHSLRGSESYEVTTQAGDITTTQSDGILTTQADGIMTTQSDGITTTQLPPCICYNGGQCSNQACTCLQMFSGSQCETNIGCKFPPVPSSGLPGGYSKIVVENPSPVKIELFILKSDGISESLQALSEEGGPWEKNDVPIGSRLYVKDYDQTPNVYLPMKSSTGQWFCWIDMPPTDLHVYVFQNYTP